MYVIRLYVRRSAQCSGVHEALDLCNLKFDLPAYHVLSS